MVIGFRLLRPPLEQPFPLLLQKPHWPLRAPPSSLWISLLHPEPLTLQCHRPRLIPCRPQGLDLGTPPPSKATASRPLVSLTSPPGVPAYPLQPSGPLRSPARASAQVHTPTGPKASSGPRSLVSSPLRLPEYPLQGPLRPRSEVREDFPPLPVELQATCRILRGGSLSWQERVLGQSGVEQGGRDPAFRAYQQVLLCAGCGRAQPALCPADLC